jgi:hypothetical protein
LSQHKERGTHPELVEQVQKIGGAGGIGAIIEGERHVVGSTTSGEVRRQPANHGKGGDRRRPVRQTHASHGNTKPLSYWAHCTSSLHRVTGREHRCPTAADQAYETLPGCVIG